MQRRHIPRWATTTWVALVVAVFVISAIEALRVGKHPVDYVGAVLWAGIVTGYVAIPAGALLFGLVWLIRYLHGKEELPKSEADDSDVANLV